VLLDFPDHCNIGDSAIYAGEVSYFDRVGAPSYVATTLNCNWEEVAKRSADGIIYLHGGGNFGDIWPHFQNFREEVISRFPEKRIVQLPQSIFYRDEAAIERTARVIDRHRDFILFVRDVPSLELAQRHFQCDVRLCPDMAFCLGPLTSTAPVQDILLHLRTDQEAREAYEIGENAQDLSCSREDWPDEPETFRRTSNLKGFVPIIAGALRGGLPGERIARYRHRAQTRLNRGVVLLSKAKVVITDRLHGHIISTLIGRPHIVLDNSYGKIARFTSAWSSLHPEDGVASSLQEAIELARSRLSSA